jgi:hypothetical protein
MRMKERMRERERWDNYFGSLNRVNVKKREASKQKKKRERKEEERKKKIKEERKKKEKKEKKTKGSECQT